MKKIIFGLLICVHIFNFIILYTIMPYKDFGEHHADNIPLNDVLVDEIDEGRLLPVNFETWEKTPNNDCEYYTVPTFGFNYGLLLGIDCFGGYEQMMPDDNFNATLEINDTGYFISDKGIPINYLRNAGVKYYLLANTDKWNAKDILESNGLVIKYEDDVRTLYYDNKAKSLVYLESEDNNLIEEVNRTTNTVSASVDLAEEDTIIFNYLYNSFFKAYLDGQETELLKINDMYMGININKGKHDIMIRYENPYFKWGIIAALGYLFAIYLWSILKKHQFFLAIKAK